MLLRQAHDALMVERITWLDIEHQLCPGAVHRFEDVLIRRDPLISEFGMDITARIQGLDLGERHAADLTRTAGGPVNGIVVHDDGMAV